MSRKIITEDISMQMEEDYNNGLSTNELALKYGFKPNSIYRHFYKKGKRISTAKKFTEEELNDIIDDYFKGLKPIELGEKYNRSSSSIINKLKQIGVYKNSTHRFTDDDIDFLRIYYPLGDWDTIFNHIPDTSKSSIHSLMSKLNIKADRYYEDNIWTEDELAILCENYVYGNKDKLCEMLPNRNYKAITTKAKRIGLSTREYWSVEEQKYLQQFYHTKSLDEIMNRFPNRSRNAVIAQAQKLNLISINRYNNEETQFIIENWKIMTDREMEKHLGKPLRSVTTKRISMGLLRMKEKSSYIDLSEYVRRNNLEWKKESMINCGYKCFLTGERFDDIHHIYSLNLILNETLESLNIQIMPTMDDYSKEELKDILDTFRELQKQYPVGVCLQKEIHTLFHNIYGYGNNTPEQWYEFVSDFKNGKYIHKFNIA